MVDSNVDLNYDGVYGFVNNIFETMDGASGEVATNSDDLGQFFFLLIVLVIVGLIIALIFGIPQKLFRGLGGFLANLKKM